MYLYVTCLLLFQVFPYDEAYANNAVCVPPNYIIHQQKIVEQMGKIFKSPSKYEVIQSFNL
jgi:hypothetical protein